MKVAISIFRSRVSPVFDWCKRRQQEARGTRSSGNPGELRGQNKEHSALTQTGVCGKLYITTVTWTGGHKQPGNRRPDYCEETFA